MKNMDELNTMATEHDQVRDLIAAQAADYFVARRGGNVSEQEDREFLFWLRTSPVHVAEYLAIAGLAKEVPGAARRLDLSIEKLSRQRAAEETSPLFIRRRQSPRRANQHFRFNPAPPSPQPSPRWGEVPSGARR